LAAFGVIVGGNDQDVVLGARRVFISGSGAVGTRPVSQVLANDGMGNFALANGFEVGNISAEDLALGDVDGDNDQDLIMVGINASRLFINESVISASQDPFIDFSMSLSVYPNPVSEGKLYIDLPDLKSSILSLRVFDMLGRQMIQDKRQITFGMELLDLDISSLRAGTYLLELGDEKRRGIVKFVVE